MLDGRGNPVAHTTWTVHPPPVQKRVRRPGGMDPQPTRSEDRRRHGPRWRVQVRANKARTIPDHAYKKNGTTAPIPIAFDSPPVNEWRANTCMSTEEDRCGPCGLRPSARAPLLSYERLEGGPSPGYLSSDGS
eukprot:scaffold616_cov306-Pavlova_lutheri.AAC.36